MSSIKRKCYISYKFEDEYYKRKIIEKYGDIAFIDKSQKFEIDSDDPDIIMQQIREKYLKDTTVTIFLIGTKSFENYRDSKDLLMGYDSQIIIRKEIKASLYNGNDNTRNGLLGIVLPEMENKIYKKTEKCQQCGEIINIVNLNNSTVIKEFWKNYYLKPVKYCNHFDENGRYAILVRYSDFMSNPGYYIEMAYKKRSEPISNFVRVKNFD